MERALRWIAATLVILAGATACPVVEPSPYAHGLLQPAFNRAWNNAIDAMKDEGVDVTVADLAGGTLEGRRGGVAVTARVVTEGVADVRTTFASDDQALAERVQKRYQERMAH
jgi:hypothetical protein